MSNVFSAIDLYHMTGDQLPAIDLHGIRLLQSAEEVLEKELYQLSTDNGSACRIIHGIGSGAMKEMVHEVLAHHPLVSEFRMSEDGGSTIVVF